jgi:hypothetical protein
MDVCGQIFCRVEKPQKSLPAHTGGGVASPIPRCNLLVPRTLVVAPDSLLDRRVLDYEEPPIIPPRRGSDGVADPVPSNPITSGGLGRA